MTDKQIIIDGIDVSGCGKQGETINGITCGKGERIRLANEIITKHKLCKDIPNCYYKQLKRKEQECERLKRDYFKQNEWLKEQKNELDQLKAENEELKKKCKKYGEINGQETKDYAELKTENKILKEKFEIAIKNNMDKTLLRLEKGDVQEELQEIREQFGIETLYCHVDNTRVHRCLDVLRLKDVLAEIKEICNNNDELKGDFNLVDCDKYKLGKHNLANKILQKISEVEDETTK